MSRRTKIIASITALFAVFSVAACARHHRGPGAERAKRFVSQKVERVLDRVDASSEQKADVHRVKDQLFEEYRAAYEGSKGMKQVLLSEWQADQPDAARLHRLADERLAAYEKAVHSTIDGMIEIHGTLDKRQRGMISKKLEKRLKN